MKIQSISYCQNVNTTNSSQNKQNFKGNVGPISRVVMQPDSVVSTYYRLCGHINVRQWLMELFNQMKNIGKKEGFEVVLQGNDKRIHPDGSVFRYMRGIGDEERMSCWAQDNGIYALNRKGQPIILEHGLIRETEEGLLKARARQLGVKYKKMYSRADGGNTYFGVTQQGERYVLIGSNAIDDTALKIALHKQGIELKNLKEASNGTVRIDFEGEKYYTSINDIVNGTMPEELPAKLKQSSKKAVKDFRENIDALRAKAKEVMADDFEMDIDQIRIVSSPGFHIDMFMRPIDEKTILVYDPFTARCELTSAMLSSKTKHQCNEIKELIKKQNDFEHHRISDDGYASMDKIMGELKGLGYDRIIKVPGIFDGGSVNYMNALVHQRPNGDYVYITNAGIRSQSGLNLNDIFKNAVQKQFPQIKDFYFLGDIQGTPIGNKIGAESKGFYYINDQLLREDGGTHCCSFEMCKFPKVTK